jgi:hypothetical protein
MPALSRSFVAANYALDLDGLHAGWIRSIDGGGASAEVIVESGGGGFLRKKHLANIKYDDFTISVSFDSGRAILDWIADSWAGKATRKNGAVHSVDFNFNVQESREFRDALITEVSFPALDGSAKEPGFLTVKITPEEVIRKKAAGTSKPPAGKPGQKSWVTSNFTFDLSGFTSANVSKIDSFSIKQSVSVDSIGAARDYQKEPGTLEFPNLKVYIPKSRAEPWHTWFDDFVIKGNNGDSNEKSGVITFLTANLKTAIATIKLSNVGIFKLNDEPAVPGSEKAARVIAELYVERMELQLDKV